MPATTWQEGDLAATGEYRSWLGDRGPPHKSGSVFDGECAVLAAFLSVLPEKANILDFGCGAGRNALYLARLGHEVTVSDLSRKAMTICETRAKAEGLRVEVCAYTQGKIDANNGTFDAILAWSVLDHMTLHEMRRVVRELSRVAREGAVLLCSFDPEEDPHYFDCPYEVLGDGTFRYVGREWNGVLFRFGASLATRGSAFAMSRLR